MAGRMGSDRVTTQSLRVVQADPEKNVVLVRGSVPGPKGGTVIIRNAVKHGASSEGSAA
jgi:large subunit ribosomal protein L3